MTSNIPNFPFCNCSFPVPARNFLPAKAWWLNLPEKEQNELLKKHVPFSVADLIDMHRKETSK